MGNNQYRRKDFVHVDRFPLLTLISSVDLKIEEMVKYLVLYQ